MRSSLRSVPALLFAAGALAACHHKPAPTPEQVATTDMAAYQADIKKIVKDPSRADSMIALTNEYAAELNKAATQLKEDGAKLAALDLSFTATRADYTALLDQRSATRTAFVKEALAMRQRMAALVTDEEWAQLKDARVKELTAGLQELQN